LRVYGPIQARTDLPPLALAVVVLEETLVVGHTVLTEHEARAKESVCFAIARPERPSPQRHQSQLNPEDRSRNSMVALGFVREEFVQQFKENTYPAMRELVARNIFAVGKEKERGLEIQRGRDGGVDEVGPE
jgi:hypothetical protein